VKLCIRCYNEFSDKNEFCPRCGAAVKGNTKTENLKGISQQKPLKDEGFSIVDIEQNRFMAAISYLGIPVLITWFAASKSKYARFHAKQGLNLLAMMIVYFIASHLLRLIKVTKITHIMGQAYQYKDTPEILSIMLLLICIPIAALSIIGFVNAVMGRAKELPVLGRLKIIK
jgi:uncharacterized Tic20 family protein